MSTAPTPSFPPDLQQFIQDQLAAGKYHSESEVMCDAVRLLRERELRLDALRKDIDQGLAQLDSGECVEIRSEIELKSFLDDIASRGQQRLVSKRTRQ